MNMLILMVWLWSPAPETVFEPIYTPAAIPETSTYHLRQPISVDFDGANRMYLLDLASRVIFRWNADGTYDGVIGGPGHGPGEFAFNGRSGPQAHLAIVGEQIFVFDGGKSVVSTFDLEGNYQTDARIKRVRGRTEGFFVTQDHSFILFNHQFMDDKAGFELIKCDTAGMPLETLVRLSEKEIGRPDLAPRDGKVMIEAYYPEVVAGFNRATNQVLAGVNGKPQFEVIHLSSAKRTVVNMPLIQRDVTRHDQLEFNNQPWLRRHHYQTVFPEKMPYYDKLVPVGSEAVLVYRESPVHREQQGVVVAGDGRILSRFEQIAGNGGGFFGASGRVVRVLVDVEGFYQVEEVRIQ